MQIDAETFANLETMNAGIAACNANDRARVLIQALIETSVNRGSDIVSALAQLGFDKRHAGATLANGCGTDPKRFDWHKNADGTYVIH
jgi:hypothetical protein